ncbi:MAG: NAD(P)/FAD-dependent oxidoreductase [Planctomycetota bacterium]
MVRKRETDVVIVGAGPVGLFAANLLGGRGLGAQIFDQDWRTALHTYAAILHPSTLRLLASVGLERALLGSGYRLEKVGFYERDTLHAQLDFTQLDPEYPYLFIVPQSALESAFEERLRAAHKSVDWNHRIQEISEEERSVVVTVARLDKVTSGYPIAKTEWEVTKQSRVRASYLIGADGYHSFTRRHLGLDYERLGDLINFAVFEMEIERGAGREARVYLNEDETNAYLPLGEKRCRWSFQIKMPAKKRRPDAEDLARFLAERAPWFGPVPGELLWSSYVGFDQRLASGFGRGRIWLAGDALHMNGPIGAQSINTGLREACDLSNALADILQERAGSEILASYAAERHAEWHRLLGPDRVRAVPGANAWVARRAERILPCVPSTGADLEKLLAQIGLELSSQPCDCDRWQDA